MATFLHTNLKAALEDTYDEISLFPTVANSGARHSLDIVDEVESISKGEGVSIDFWTVMGIDQHTDDGIEATPICSFDSKYEAVEWIAKMEDSYGVSFIPGTKVDLVADRFSEFLAEYVGYDSMKEIVEINSRVENLACCASHNYCDANVFMDRAMKDVGLNVEANSSLGCYVMNNAWDTAKQSSFYISGEQSPSLSL